MIYKYKGHIYPNYLKTGDAEGYIFNLARKFCRGDGLDIGGFLDWSYPGAQVINIEKKDKYDAYNLPDRKYDYIFSSHCLEHVEDYIRALEIWRDHLKKGGVLFLYLPHPDMLYWLPQNNKKHRHVFYPDIIAETLKDLGFKNVINSERDMFWSFTVVGWK